jgi:hypothetical protein
VSNNATSKELSTPNVAFLRESLAIIVRNHGPDDIVQVLSEVMDDYAIAYARRTGDYDGASAMKLTAAHLAGLEAARSNYDGAER